MNHQGKEELEVKMLTQAIYEYSGYDFREYLFESIKRRARSYCERNGITHLSELIPLVYHDEDKFSELIQCFSITVTELFRDPFVYKCIKEDVFPMLSTYPSLKIWHAGCATGEEVYSTAILLHEAGLLDRCTIYATDFNNQALSIAKRRIYEIDSLKMASMHYKKSGGEHSLSDYYHAKYEAVCLDGFLADKVTFTNHNLVTDRVFGEMHLILCRNVLIYFSSDLQNKVLTMFDESLINGGYLVLGDKETIQFTKLEKSYQFIDAKAKVYRKMYE